MKLVQLGAAVEVFDEAMARRSDLVDLDSQPEDVAGAEDEDDAEQDPRRLLATTLETTLRMAEPTHTKKEYTLSLIIISIYILIRSEDLAGTSIFMFFRVSCLGPNIILRENVFSR